MVSQQRTSGLGLDHSQRGDAVFGVSYRHMNDG